jgi:DNA-binding HxlR family transcriptional regulator
MVREPAFRCGMEAVVDLVGGKWKLLILFYLCRERLRFSELRRFVGDVSEKMLSQQLKEMVADGLLRRIDFKTVPPHVEYETTAFGQELGHSMKSLCEWGTRNMDEIATIANARAIRRGTDVQGGPSQDPERDAQS